MKRKRNVAVVEGVPGQWAINNSIKNTIFEYVRNIMANRAHFNGYFQKRGRNYIAVNNSGRVVGFAILGPNRASGTTRLHVIGTQPGQGVGGEILSQIENNARGRGVHKLRIMDPVNNARTFYEYFGYRSGARVDGNSTMYKKLSRRRSPSRPSPRAPSSSPRASPRRSPNRKTPRRQTPPRN